MESRKTFIVRCSCEPSCLPLCFHRSASVLRLRRCMLHSGDIRLHVIIPVYNNWEDTLECLQLLQSQSNRQFQVILADDGSPSPPPPLIQSFAFAEYMRNSNRGFAANCNTAASEAIARGATHLLFLN